MTGKFGLTRYNTSVIDSVGLPLFPSISLAHGVAGQIHSVPDNVGSSLCPAAMNSQIAVVRSLSQGVTCFRRFLVSGSISCMSIDKRFQGRGLCTKSNGSGGGSAPYVFSMEWPDSACFVLLHRTTLISRQHVHSFADSQRLR